MRKAHKNKWSATFNESSIGSWNCWSISNERFNCCKSLHYDILGLTEIHNKQTNELFQGQGWICRNKAKTDKEGKCSDPAAGVEIILSPRTVNKVLDTGC